MFTRYHHCYSVTTFSPICTQNSSTKMEKGAKDFGVCMNFYALLLSYAKNFARTVNIYNYLSTRKNCYSDS